VSRPKPPDHLKSKQATRRERGAMTSMTFIRNRCPGCRTVYRLYADSQACEKWHENRG